MGKRGKVKNSSSAHAYRRAKVDALLQAGLSTAAIHKIVGGSLRTVQRDVARARLGQPYPDRLRVGRPPKTTRKIRVRIAKLLRSRTAGSIRSAKRDLARHGINLSVSTIHAVAKAHGLRCVRPQPKPELNQFQRDARLRYAHDLINYSVEEIRRMVFSDEKLFVVSRGSSHVWVGKRQSIPDKPTSKDTRDFCTILVLFCSLNTWQ